MDFGFNKRRDGGGFEHRGDRDRNFGQRREFGDRGGDRGGDRRGGGGYGGGRDRDRRDREPRDDRDESVFSKRVRAGRRRTYFFDVRKTRGEDYFITITESTRREDGYGYRRHKLFLYKEDFNRFVASLNEVVAHVKTDLMPDFDYEEFDRRQAEWEAQNRDHDDDHPGDDMGHDDEQLDADDSPKAKKKEDDDMDW